LGGDPANITIMEFMEIGAAPKENLRRAFCAVFAENALRRLKR